MTNGKLLTFDILGDERGSLVALEGNKNIPFDIKRIYYIYGTKERTIRGKHAHKDLKQIIICIHGSCTFLLDNGTTKEYVKLDSPNQGLLIKDIIWREMHYFSKDCVLVVLANKPYDEDDYLRDYNEFLNFIQKSQKELK